ncbi:MAG: DUF3800 domain-containing protein [Nitrococcus sp.]|nr:DUF3800 domain-containing protein [Nitrococcus sp.]
MNDSVHIYCDESCHLEKDGQKAMVLGGLSCPAGVRQLMARRIKALKRAHGIASGREIKWTQVSPSRLAFYLALVDMFFDEPLLGFRTVVVDKTLLNHDRFEQAHDDFYYKMWWQLLTRLIDDQHCFRIFIDIKDTRSQIKQIKLHEVLCNTHYDFDSSRIRSVEAVHSHQVPLLQLVDLLIGAMSHLHRGIATSQAKQDVIRRIQKRSRLTLMRNTPPQARKFNVFLWMPRETA